MNPPISKRLNVLKNEIDKQIKRIENNENEDLLEIKYLFYDEQSKNIVEIIVTIFFYFINQ